MTSKEHFVCHHLLTKIDPIQNSYRFAFNAMCNNYTSTNQNRYIPSSRIYDKNKKNIAKIQSEKWLKDNPNNYRSSAGKNNPMYGVHRYGKENPFYGKKHTQEFKDYIGNINRGRKASEETKNKLKDVWNSRPILTCPHCGHISKHPGNMKNYHFDNCKLK